MCGKMGLAMRFLVVMWVSGGRAVRIFVLLRCEICFNNEETAGPAVRGQKKRNLSEL